MIKIQNIYYMLAYAFSFLKNNGQGKLECEQFDNAANLLSAILANGVAVELKRGLGKEYITCSEFLHTLRGKIDLSQSIKEQSFNHKKLHCHYDEFSINSKLNQIIKACMLVLIKSDVDIVYKQRLKKLLPYFTEVENIKVKNINWHIRFHRNNLNYQMIIGSCYLIVHGLLQKDQSGKIKLQKFVDEKSMARLYEKFILKYYYTHKKDYEKQGIFIEVASPRIAWQVENNFVEFLPIMQSDLILTKKDKSSCLIIDAKYYSKIMQHRQFGLTKNAENFEMDMELKKTLHSNNLYQIFSYVKNKQCQTKAKVSGMLLYAKTDENISPNAEYNMSGNNIFVKTLDLNQDFKMIRQELDNILFNWYNSKHT